MKSGSEASKGSGQIMKRVGFVGWRGMVGSVLLDRMKAEGDFQHFEATFFSTSQAGGTGPTDLGFETGTLKSAFDLEALAACDMIVTCQGGDYTSEVHPKLRAAGYRGEWIDAASTLRMKDSSVLVLDPVNRPVIDTAIAAGAKDFVGANCTVSLMLMVMHAPIQRGWVEWISSMTYQAASGAGAKNMQELVAQMRAIAGASSATLDDPKKGALELDRIVTDTMRSAAFPKSEFRVPLAGSLIPWIDKPVDHGQTKEEWKGHVEANKILGLGSSNEVTVDGLCVRVGAMRSHSQALTVKLRKAVPVDEVEACIRESNPWAKVIPNERDATERLLSPAAISGTLDVVIGRMHTMRMGPDYLTAFTAGDQLLWGAAEPLRRTLLILLGKL